MTISTAILCDFAEVRDNLLFVVAGGVTRLFRAEWPGPMNVYQDEPTLELANSGAPLR